eukprot:1903688-Amphidinium_carterae.1
MRDGHLHERWILAYLPYEMFAAFLGVALYKIVRQGPHAHTRRHARTHATGPGPTEEQDAV